MPTPGGLFRQVVYELKRMHASTSGSTHYWRQSAENLTKPLHAVRARELLFLRRMGKYAPRPLHPPAAAPGHGGGAGGDEEEEVDDFVDDALAGNECRFHAGE